MTKTCIIYAFFIDALNDNCVSFSLKANDVSTMVSSESIVEISSNATKYYRRGSKLNESFIFIILFYFDMIQTTKYLSGQIEFPTRLHGSPAKTQISLQRQLAACIPRRKTISGNNH